MPSPSRPPCPTMRRCARCSPPSPPAWRCPATLPALTATLRLGADLRPLAATLQAGAADLASYRPGLHLARLDLAAPGLDQPARGDGRGQPERACPSPRCSRSTGRARCCPGPRKRPSASPCTPRQPARGRRPRGRIRRPRRLEGADFELRVAVPDMLALAAVLPDPLPLRDATVAARVIADGSAARPAAHRGAAHRRPRPGRGRRDAADAGQALRHRGAPAGGTDRPRRPGPPRAGGADHRHRRQHRPSRPRPLAPRRRPRRPRHQPPLARRRPPGPAGASSPTSPCRSPPWPPGTAGSTCARPRRGSTAWTGATCTPRSRRRMTCCASRR